MPHLTWNDLDFEEDYPTWYKVDICGTTYLLYSMFDSKARFDVVRLFTFQGAKELCSFWSNFEEEIDFFNNLKMRLVEKEN